MRIAIIGTREVTKVQLVRIHKAIDTRFGSDVVVHSGGAVGVDQVAYKFSKTNVFLPWATYNANVRPKGNKAKFIVKGDDTRYDEMLTKLFPHFTKMTQGVKKLLRRNAFIVLGYDDVPRVDTVVWYTGKGVKGGTAYGVIIARHHGIKTVELKDTTKAKEKQATASPQFDRVRFNKYVELVADFRKYYKVNAKKLLSLKISKEVEEKLNLDNPNQVLYEIIKQVRIWNGKEYKVSIETEVESIIKKVNKIKEERKESAVAGSSLSEENSNKTELSMKGIGE